MKATILPCVQTRKTGTFAIANKEKCVYLYSIFLHNSKVFFWVDIPADRKENMFMLLEDNTFWELFTYWNVSPVTNT